MIKERVTEKGSLATDQEAISAHKPQHETLICIPSEIDVSKSK